LYQGPQGDECNKLYRVKRAMLSGSLVTAAWHFMRLVMEETVARYAGQLGIY
jgi:hypothetical protein